MGTIRNRLDILQAEHLKLLPMLEERIGAEKYDWHGRAKADLSGNYRFLSICEYALNKDIVKFRKYLRDSANLIADMFVEYKQGKKIDHSYLGMINYNEMLDSAASGDFELTKKLAGLIGEREEDRKSKHFQDCIEYCLKYIILRDTKNLEPYVGKCLIACEQKQAKNYKGYAMISSAILNKDEKKLNEGFFELITAHKRMCKGSGFFSDTEDEIVFLHGLGLANICLDLGFNFTIKDPLIPEELLIRK
jgi:hypothetical protein